MRKKMKSLDVESWRKTPQKENEKWILCIVHNVKHNEDRHLSMHYLAA